MAGLGVLAVLGSAGASQATTHVVEQSMSRYVACYNRVYVPARVLVNTRGRLVRGPGQAWETGAGQWNLVRDPAVFIQTRRVIEPDHYTLVARGCP